MIAVIILLIFCKGDQEERTQDSDFSSSLNNCITDPVLPTTTELLHFFFGKTHDWIKMDHTFTIQILVLVFHCLFLKSNCWELFCIFLHIVAKLCNLSLDAIRLQSGNKVLQLRSTYMARVKNRIYVSGYPTSELDTSIYTN